MLATEQSKAELERPTFQGEVGHAVVQGVETENGRLGNIIGI